MHISISPSTQPIHSCKHEISYWLIIMRSQGVESKCFLIIHSNTFPLIAHTPEGQISTHIILFERSLSIPIQCFLEVLCYTVTRNLIDLAYLHISRTDSL